ncbi:MAG: hypothetical protein ABI823_21115 [Bryobacteraceae bacterium]
MRKFPDQQLAVFVVWERVLSSDWSAPISAVLGRIPDLRVAQFWDPERALSHQMGESKDRKSIVWDWVGVYRPGQKWNGVLPEAAYTGRPVVQVAAAFEDALRKELTSGNLAH